MRFGALLVDRRGKIIGRGWNRRAQKEERERLPWLDYAIHAEEAAYLDSLNSKKKPNCLYVAGFSNKGVPMVREVPFFACVRCAKNILIPHEIPVRVLTESGWQLVDPRRALETSEEVYRKGFWEQQRVKAPVDGVIRV